MRPEAWPITSCMSVVSSPPSSANFAARSRFLGRPGELAAHRCRASRGSYASFTFDSDTDLLPYFSRIAWSFGRLMPIGVTGPESPVSTTTSMALATMPWTFGLRYFGSHGMWSSNHCAFSASFLMRAGLLLVDVEDERLPTRP